MSTTAATTSCTTATSNGGGGGQLMELPATASPVVVGAGEAEMASWLHQVLEEGAASDYPPADQPAVAATFRPSGLSSDGGLNDVVRGAASGAAVAAAGKRPAVEEQYNCPGCCRPTTRSGGGGKRSGAGRAAEQRRRDKINEKLRTLQQLVPRSNKTDKVSTLDAVIQHIKYLQHQLQMMSDHGGYAMAQPYLQPAGGGVVFGCRPPPPPPSSSTTTAATLLRHHQQLVPAPMLACPHHHCDAAAVSPPPPPRFPASAGDPSQK